MTDDLPDWLRAQLDIDEQIARDAAHLEAGNWTTKDGYPVSVADELLEAADTFERVVVFDEGSPSEEQARHIAEHDPARVLREIDASRVLLTQYETLKSGMPDHMAGVFALEAVVRAKADVYADRPGYCEEWRP